MGSSDRRIEVRSQFGNPASRDRADDAGSRSIRRPSRLGRANSRHWRPTPARDHLFLKLARSSCGRLPCGRQTSCQLGMAWIEARIRLKQFSAAEKRHAFRIVVFLSKNQTQAKMPTLIRPRESGYCRDSTFLLVRFVAACGSIALGVLTPNADLYETASSADTCI